MECKLKDVVFLHFFLFRCLSLGNVLGETISPKITPFPMTHVRLLDGPFKTSQDINREYLDSFDADLFLKNFRVNAKLPAPGKDLTNWESPDCAIRNCRLAHSNARMSSCTFFRQAEWSS